ncbi:AHH domain-containing protein [Xanthomonas phaseoli]|uniref:AHH domain-containing protein n=1 Tax=Xanthomonas phaseoli TaxID=1985254 RepID=UPI001ED903A3|nr:AHH domain-containing protein [Xanthomonas phaseoli]
MPNYRTLFQDHHNIEQQTLKNSELLAKLQETGRFDIHAPENRLFLPSDPQFAQALDITPHSGGPLGAYQNGVIERLDDLQATRDGRAALRGDPEALDRVAQRVEQLRDTIKVGLINGDLNTNTPVGLTPSQAGAKVQNFFRDTPGYHQTHAQQIDGLKGFTGVDHGWGGVANSESRIVTALDQIQVSSTAIARGGNPKLQRSGLSLAIANAHHDGRVVLSEQGILKVEQVLGEEAAHNLRVPRGQRGAASMEVLLGNASASTLVRSGGLLATGADAVLTARRSAELLEQGNATAAQSEVQHAIARNVGGWAGGASTAAVLGGSGFVPAALVVGDALLMSKAFDKGADLLDNRAIYHQTDKAGVEWQFNGRNWQRDAAIELVQDGRRTSDEQPVVASYEKSQELDALANAKAVELALGKVLAPQDPFNLPAQASDQVGLDNQNWHRNPTTELWERQVKTALAGANDRGSYEHQTASPERAQQLNQEALGRIESNIATGREAIAAAYLENHAAQRAQAYGVEVPAAVLAAQAKPGAVIGSDAQLYQRTESGQWAGKNGVASGNLAMELELTDQLRQPSIERAQEILVGIRALPAPTAAQMEHNGNPPAH